MSEDDEQQPHVEFLPMPEAFVQSIRQMEDTRMMRGEAWRHEVRGFFDSLTMEQSLTLKRMLSAIGDEAKPSNLSNFWEGHLNAMLDLKFDVCPGCGKNHDEMLMEALQEQHAPDAPGTPEEEQ